jgi:hypothetical protein
MSIGVYRNEFDALHLLPDHVVDSVGTAPTQSNDLDPGRVSNASF